ncbi:MAG TPA: DUF5615 family PIN-like protein [archaeon]|nr:DUF5615 family PIN-like protein [archaeon]
MKFLADENIPVSITSELRRKGFNVKSLKELKLFGIPDRRVLEIAKKMDRVIITYDKDFLNLFRISNQNHKGIILLRLFPPEKAIEKIIPILKTKSKKIKNKLVIVSNNYIEIIKK